MMIFLIASLMGVVVFCEMRLRSPSLRVAVVVLVCLTCIVFSGIAGREFGDAFARNSVMTVVSNALNVLEQREMEGIGNDERIKLIRMLSEQLPAALMDDRKASTFLNKLEHEGDYYRRGQP